MYSYRPELNMSYLQKYQNELEKKKKPTINILSPSKINYLHTGISFKVKSAKNWESNSQIRDTRNRILNASIRITDFLNSNSDQEQLSKTFKSKKPFRDLIFKMQKNEKKIRDSAKNAEGYFQKNKDDSVLINSLNRINLKEKTGERNEKENKSHALNLRQSLGKNVSEKLSIKSSPLKYKPQFQHFLLESRKLSAQQKLDQQNVFKRQKTSHRKSVGLNDEGFQIRKEFIGKKKVGNKKKEGLNIFETSESLAQIERAIDAKYAYYFKNN